MEHSSPGSGNEGEQSPDFVDAIMRAASAVARDWHGVVDDLLRQMKERPGIVGPGNVEYVSALQAATKRILELRGEIQNALPSKRLEIALELEQYLKVAAGQLRDPELRRLLAESNQPDLAEHLADEIQREIGGDS